MILRFFSGIPASCIRISYFSGEPRIIRRASGARLWTTFFAAILHQSRKLVRYIFAHVPRYNACARRYGHASLRRAVSCHAESANE